MVPFSFSPLQVNGNVKIAVAVGGHHHICQLCGKVNKWEERNILHKFVGIYAQGCRAAVATLPAKGRVFTVMIIT